MSGGRHTEIDEGRGSHHRGQATDPCSISWSSGFLSLDFFGDSRRYLSHCPLHRESRTVLCRPNDAKSIKGLGPRWLSSRILTVKTSFPSTYNSTRVVFDYFLRRDIRYSPSAKQTTFSWNRCRPRSSFSHITKMVSLVPASATPHQGACWTLNPSIPPSPHLARWFVWCNTNQNH